jgi:hypothetical protein
VDLLVDGKLVTFGRHQGEFFFFNALIALSRESYARIGSFRGAVTSEELTSGAFGAFPGTVVKLARKRREYVNGVLSRNEVNSNAEFTKQQARAGCARPTAAWRTAARLPGQSC